MRHKRRGRRLGRSSSHRKAMMRNMATSLFLTVRREEERHLKADEDGIKFPEDGRIRTTLQKAKEVRGLVEKCITLAVRSRESIKHAESLNPGDERDSEWRQSDAGREWAAARAPVVAAQRRIMQLLGNKRKKKRMGLKDNSKQRKRGQVRDQRLWQHLGGIRQTPQRRAVHVLFAILAERFEDRPGGYTRILRLAEPRLGDAGTRAILEIITPDNNSDDKHRRIRAGAEKPEFLEELDTAAAEEGSEVAAEDDAQQVAAADDAQQEAVEDDAESATKPDDE